MMRRGLSEVGGCGCLYNGGLRKVWGLHKWWDFWGYEGAWGAQWCCRCGGSDRASRGYEGAQGRNGAVGGFGDSRGLLGSMERGLWPRITLRD
ncbi:hypothetical protein GUJ93_ZPchr0015g6687 [Zizania palustris]|uniref:Uncharacterized protein n=1 Tax=Zizania palustris TaxID=103762 RepID=A0A8J5TD36_ZIZPA|nr:hypothetical protein GUJ93_ZPchr0015g6687 [Zizania palustris]